MEITDKDVLKTAVIARINISEEELSKLTDNIKRIINYIRNKLDEFDERFDPEQSYFDKTDSVKTNPDKFYFKKFDPGKPDIKNNTEIEHFAATNALREDMPESHFSREDMMANAPDSEDGFFRVPKVVPWKS
ncbi:MAG: aspartyl/glutamyl-tRNA amidotransferase subunit C [Clostridiaceae bacterium]|jgi:Asp-tRNA(Asn)/Glu-tRNA(Gln) amidotransferase C subunit|nr:aspartyl/glutamyl-tRNA amidotransferase subunit C [Clostridiaceae bacterium]